MFRLQENIPEIYLKNSRDFQLISRIYDLSNNAVRYTIKSMSNMLDPMLVSSRLLPLLCTRVGFFPKAQYNSNALRHILSVFPYAIKYKGSKKGIDIAINGIMKAENNFDEYHIFIDRAEKGIINIETKTEIRNKVLLYDVLSYVIPIGYDIQLGVYTQQNATDNIDGFNKINLQKNATRNVSVIPNIQNANNIRIEQDNYIYGSNILDNTNRQVEYESVYNAHAVLNSADIIEKRESPGTEHTVIDYEIRSDN